MKIAIPVLLAVSGLSMSAHAQYNTSIPGPIGVTSTITTTDLNGATIPAGTYRRYTVVTDWVAGANGPFSDEAIFAFVNNPAPLPAGSVFLGDPGPFFGAFGDGTARNGMNVDAYFETPYIAGNPLFFATLQTFAGSDAAWSNIQITLTTTNFTLPTPNATIPSLAFPALGSPFASVSNNTIALTGGDTKWVKITIPAGGVTAVNGRFVDIDTEGSALAPTNDTLIALYDANGQLIASDDDEGAGLVSQLSFGGNAAPRPAAGTSQPYNGRDGELPAGDYYLAILSTGDDVNTPLSRIYTGYAIANASTNAGPITVNIKSGTVSTVVCTVNDAEPNNTKATAQSITLANGDALCGTSTGTTGTGLTSRDYYKVRGQIPQPGQILLNRLNYTSGTPNHVVTLRGLSVSATGVITPGSDVLLQFLNLPTETNPNSIQWYSLGNSTSTDAYKVIFRVGGDTTTTAQYSFQYLAQAITPIDAGAPFTPGTVTISSEGLTTTDTDLWIYDSNLNPIAALGSDDNAANAQSTVSGTFAAGTYYVAISSFNLANDLVSPATDGNLGGDIIDFPGVIISDADASGGPITCDFTITDSSGTPRVIPVQIVESNEVKFVKFVVQDAVALGCSPSDIAYGDGEPLPPIGQPGGFNPVGPDGGDFDCFFNFYFSPSPDNAVCDIAYGDGEPLPPYGQPGGFNPGVDGGDFDCFFNFYFNGCL